MGWTSQRESTANEIVCVHRVDFDTVAIHRLAVDFCLHGFVTYIVLFVWRKVGRWLTAACRPISGVVVCSEGLFASSFWAKCLLLESREGEFEWLFITLNLLSVSLFLEKESKYNRVNATLMHVQRGQIMRCPCCCRKQRGFDVTAWPGSLHMLWLNFDTVVYSLTGRGFPSLWPMLCGLFEEGWGGGWPPHAAQYQGWWRAVRS